MKSTQVSMSGESLSLLPVDQDLHASDFGVVHVKRDHDGGYGQLFRKHARRMRVGEGGVRVHNGGVIAEQVNIADVRASAYGMWRRGLQILSEESTQYGAGAFGALRWQGHIHLDRKS